MMSNDLPAPENRIQRVYEDAIWGLGAAGRFKCMCDMHQSIVDMMSHQERLRHHGQTEMAIRLDVMERMYRSDPRTLALIAHARTTHLG